MDIEYEGYIVDVQLTRVKVVVSNKFRKFQESPEIFNLRFTHRRVDWRMKHRGVEVADPRKLYPLG